MSRLLSKVVINLVVIAMAVPASLACAARPGDSTVGAPASRTTTAAPSLRTSTERAVAATLSADHLALQGPGVPSRPATVGIRAQGGGKGAMVTGIVSTVIGIAGTVYMLKYLKDQQKKTEGQ